MVPQLSSSQPCDREPWRLGDTAVGVGDKSQFPLLWFKFVLIAFHYQGGVSPTVTALSFKTNKRSTKTTWDACCVANLLIDWGLIFLISSIISWKLITLKYQYDIVWTAYIKWQWLTQCAFVYSSHTTVNMEIHAWLEVPVAKSCCRLLSCMQCGFITPVLFHFFCSCVVILHLTPWLVQLRNGP